MGQLGDNSLLVVFEINGGNTVMDMAASYAQMNAPVVVPDMGDDILILVSSSTSLDRV